MKPSMHRGWMARRGILLGPVVFSFFGCASGGNDPGEGTVPVYSTPAEVPCEYEVMDTIRRQGSIRVSPTAGGQEFENTREHTLGRAGARAGADAVIVVHTERPPIRVAIPLGEMAQVPVTFQGETVRFLDPACRVAAPSVNSALPEQCQDWQQVGIPTDMAQTEVSAVHILMGALAPEGADLLPISGDRILLQNPDEIRELLRRGYPPLLRDAGIAGTVRVLLLVSESGSVHSVHTVQSSGHRALDDAALSVAKRAEFAPQRSGDTPICHWVSYPFTFARR